MVNAREAGQVAVVVNPGSRRGAAAAEQTAVLLGSSGPGALRSFPVGPDDDLPTAIDRALESGPDLLVVGGGDGTVSCAAARVAHTDVTLGVLPLGTANDFARTLQIPTDLTDAVATLASGKVVDVDLGRVEGHTFLNVASIGLSVAVTERLTAGLKRRLGPLAYPAATLRAYRHHEPFGVRLEFHDDDHAPLELEDLIQVAVGNGRHYGGGNVVAPAASLDDHSLDVYAVVRGRLRDHVSIARFLKDGRFVDHDRVHHLTTQRIRLVTDRPLPVNLDGEIALETPATFEVDRNAVRVVVPQHSEAAVMDGRESGTAEQPRRA